MCFQRRNSWVYQNDKLNLNRYLLGERGTQSFLVIGINPSTAEPDNLDPTLTKVRALSIHHHFQGWLMMNVYPQRSTNPTGIDQIRNINIHKKNIKAIKSVFRRNKNRRVVAAWGNNIHLRGYLMDSLREIFDLSVKYNIRWVCFGINTTGDPVHPLYLSVPNSTLFLYDIRIQYGF